MRGPLYLSLVPSWQLPYVYILFCLYAYATRTVYPRNYGTSRLPSSATATNPARSTHRSLSQTLTAGYHINSSTSSNKQASRSTTPPPTNFKDFSIPIRKERIPATERDHTGSVVSVAKSTSGETGRNLPTRLKEALWSTPTSRTTELTGRQLNSSHHPGRIREAIEIFKHDTVPQDIGFYISDIWRRTKWSSISKLHNPHLQPKSTTPPSPCAS